MATLPEMIQHCGTIEAATEFAKQLGPEYSLDLQLLLAAQGRWSEAATVNAARPRNTPRDVYASGLFSIIEGDLPRGIWEMHVGRSDHLFGSPAQLPKTLLTPDKLSEISGRTVLLRCEGGLGDEIINIRFAKNLADLGAKVIVSCHAELASVFDRVAGVSAAISTNSEQYVYYDYWLPAMSAPGILNIGFDQLNGAPYITPREETREAWRILMGEKTQRRVGIKWTGNPRFEHEQFRRFPEHLLFDALNPQDEIWNLDLDNTPPEHVRNAVPFINGWEDTLGALSNCDLIVTSCTSIAHAAGALGIPTFVIVPVMPYYTWAYPIDGGRSPWYNSVTLFRQATFGDWSQPFEKLKEALCGSELKMAA